MSIPDLEAQK